MQNKEDRARWVVDKRWWRCADKSRPVDEIVGGKRKSFGGWDPEPLKRSKYLCSCPSAENLALAVSRCLDPTLYAASGE